MLCFATSGSIIAYIAEVLLCMKEVPGACTHKNGHIQKSVKI